MNLEKVVFAFVILSAATLNFGFVFGATGSMLYHNQWEFFAAVVVNVIATVLKFGDRTQVGATHLATSLVALLQLGAAALLWTLATPGPDGLPTAATMAGVVSLSAGALLANFVSVVILIVETTLQRR
ncbi:MAG: hypothetical protein IT495_03015 [Gammaproteobacteria bacterium]|nr:hypothetical protein [Gammaproteobacteria bacterium]